MMTWTTIAALAAIVGCTATALLIQRLRLQRFLLSELACAPAAPEGVGEIFDPGDANFHARLGRQIFSPEDLPLLDEYPAAIRRNYLLRKRAVAIEWLGEGRRRMRHVMRAHRRAARADSLLQPREELALLANYWSFVSMCAFCEAWTLLAGPLALRGAVERASHCHQTVSALLLKSAGIGTYRLAESP